MQLSIFVASPVSVSQPNLVESLQRYSSLDSREIFDFKQTFTNNAVQLNQRNNSDGLATLTSVKRVGNW